MRSLAARIRRLEPKRAASPRAPHVLEVRPGEPLEDALARFERRWGRTSKGHTFMVVPARMTVEEWRRFVADDAAASATRHNVFTHQNSAPAAGHSAQASE